MRGRAIGRGLIFGALLAGALTAPPSSANGPTPVRAPGAARAAQETAPAPPGTAAAPTTLPNPRGAAVQVALAATSPRLAPRQRQRFFVERSGAAHEATRAARAAGKSRLAKRLARISNQPQAHWVGDWLPAAQVRKDVRRFTRAARRAGRTPVLVLYAIPGRDCGGHSAGGFTPMQYRRWVTRVARGLRDGAVRGRSDAVVVLEPDALSLDCGGARRDRLLRQATKRLAKTGAWVYIDAGHSGWHPPAEVAARLARAGIRHARGFATNVSNFNRTAAERRYGNTVARELKKRGVRARSRNFVIDSSRNGRGPTADAQWCNPRGRGLGARPRWTNRAKRLDALLWVKRPGESDGSCQGGPPAGRWWQEYALELVKNRKR